MADSKRLDTQGPADSVPTETGTTTDRLEAAVGSDFGNDLPLEEVTEEAAPTESEDRGDAAESQVTGEETEQSVATENEPEVPLDAEQQAAEDRMASYVSGLQNQAAESANTAQQATADYSHLQSFADRRDTEARQEIGVLKAQIAELQTRPTQQTYVAPQQAQQEAPTGYEDDLYETPPSPTGPAVAQPQTDPALSAEVTALRQQVAAYGAAKQQSEAVAQQQALQVQAVQMRDHLVSAEGMTQVEAETAVLLRYQGDVDKYSDMVSTARSRRVLARRSTREEAQVGEEAASGGANRSAGRTRAVVDAVNNHVALTQEDLEGMSAPEKASVRAAKWGDVVFGSN